MKCPTCGHEGSGIIKSGREPDTVRRRRQCCQCGFRWTTVEIPADAHKRATKALEMIDMAGAIARGTACATETVHGPDHHEVQVHVPPTLKFGKA